jgi:hypothetical protein
LGSGLNSKIVVDVSAAWTGSSTGFNPGALVALKYQTKAPRPVWRRIELGLDTEFDWAGPSGDDPAEEDILIGPHISLTDDFALRGGVETSIIRGATGLGGYVSLVWDGNVKQLFSPKPKPLPRQ